MCAQVRQLLLGVNSRGALNSRRKQKENWGKREIAARPRFRRRLQRKEDVVQTDCGIKTPKIRLRSSSVNVNEKGVERGWNPVTVTRQQQV